jgi:acyl carrier protein
MTDAPAKQLPTPPELEQQLAQFINGTLLGGGASVGRDTRLFEDGYMNSLRILDLIAMVEKTLGRRVPDRAVRLANFRTIAAIVQAFHPDAAAAPSPAASDRIFERRTDRARFGSPIPALQERGELTIPGAGRVALSGLPLEILEAVDRTAVEWAHALGAAEHRYPSLIDRGVLERAGRVVIPSRGAKRRRRGIATVPVEGLAPLSGESRFLADARNDTDLSPAVCYHAYPEWTEKTVGPEPTLITARGHCYREEDGNYAPLERLWEFTMREIIVIGTREQVEDVRQSLVRQVTTFVESLGLDASVETATDPFFVTGDEGRRLMQQAGALKYELQLTVDEQGRGIAAASFNHHYDFFGTRFGVRLENDTPAHSGCVAFGLERWVLALLAQHGVDPNAWPRAARAWLDDSGRHSHGVRA